MIPQIQIPDRYERLRDIPTLSMDKIRRARVLVVGAGAVGNEVVKNLALFGVGQVFIVDFDRVEKSNLSRSVFFRDEDTRRRSPKAKMVAKRAGNLNPDCIIHASNADICYGIGLGLFRRMDAIISCVDSRFARLMISRYAYWFNKPWINAGILDAEGICTVYQPGINDYESELSDIAWKNISKRFGCPDLARQYFNEGSTPTTPVAASIIGAMQVSEAMKVIHGYNDQLLAGIEFRFNLRKNEFELIECRDIDPQSESNLRITDIQELSLSHLSTVGALKQEVGRLTEGCNYEIVLRDAVVTRVVRESDKRSFSVLVPESGLADYVHKHIIEDKAADQFFNRVFISAKSLVIARDDPRFDKYSLRRIGIPALDIITVRTENRGTFFIELSNDTVKYGL